jgi:hypothetical protein
MNIVATAEPVASLSHGLANSAVGGSRRDKSLRQLHQIGRLGQVRAFHDVLGNGSAQQFHRHVRQIVREQRK